MPRVGEELEPYIESRYRVERRMSQTAADWIVAHRGTAPQPTPPKHRPPYVIGADVLDPTQVSA